MEIIKKQHTFWNSNANAVYRMQQIPGDIDTEYVMELDEFDSAVLPDSEYYSVLANDFFRAKINFPEWVDANECKYVGFSVRDGKKIDFEEIDLDSFKARCANRVVIR